MNLLDVLSLQKPRDTEFHLAFTGFVKKQMGSMGWKKGDRITVYRHGAGFFIAKNAASATADDLQFLHSQPEQEKRKGK